jgi:hypothetical protein
MTYSAEFIINTGQFEHVKLVVTCDNGLQLQDELDVTMGTLDNDLALKLGQTHASIKAAILYGRDNPDITTMAEDPILDDVHVIDELGRAEGKDDSTEKLIIQELKAKAIETVTHDAPQKPWERPLKVAEPKEWESVQAAPAAPAVTGLEDF